VQTRGDAEKRLNLLRRTAPSEVRESRSMRRDDQETERIPSRGTPPTRDPWRGRRGQGGGSLQGRREPVSATSWEVEEGQIVTIRVLTNAKNMKQKEEMGGVGDFVTMNLNDEGG